MNDARALIVEGDLIKNGDEDIDGLAGLGGRYGGDEVLLSILFDPEFAIIAS